MRICFVADARSIHTRKWVQYFLERGNEILVFSRYKVPIPGTKVLPWKNLFVSPWGSDIINDYSWEIEGLSFYRRFLFRQARMITATSHFLADVTRHYWLLVSHPPR